MGFRRVARLQQQQQQQPSSTMSSPEINEDYEPLAASSFPSPAPPTTTTTPVDGTTPTNGWGTLSSETISKITELRRLAYQYGLFSEPEIVVKCATHFALMGDNSILEEKLEQLHTFGSTMGYARNLGWPLSV